MVELVGGGSVINGADPVQFKKGSPLVLMVKCFYASGRNLIPVVFVVVFCLSICLV